MLPSSTKTSRNAGGASHRRDTTFLRVAGPRDKARERSSISPVETCGQAHRKHTGSFIDKSHRR